MTSGLTSANEVRSQPLRCRKISRRRRGSRVQPQILELMALGIQALCRLASVVFSFPGHSEFIEIGGISYNGTIKENIDIA